MLRKAITVLTLATIAGFGTANADSLVIEGIDATAKSAQPDRGISQTTVESRWGAPTAKSSAVGEPPISSWEYEPFVVYFEYDKVIHTVAKR